MKRTIYTLIVLVCFIAGSCATDLDVSGSAKNTEQIDLKFTVKVAGAKLPSTRAMSTDSENDVRRVDILVFEVGGDMSETFAYHTKATKIDNTDAQSKTISANVIKGGTKKYRFVLLANLPADQLGVVISISKGTPKSDVLATILSSNTGEWNVDPILYTPIPMWAESDSMVVNDDLATTGIQNMKLIHMLARIDVVLIDDAPTNFVLETVRLFNYNTSGRIAPSAELWNSGTNTALSPSLPNDPGNTPGPLVYNSAAPEDPGILKTIYVYEAAARSELNNAMNIVIGGRFKDDGYPTYYRIDFLEINRETVMNILRNHLYRINITEVSARGYATFEEAFKSKPINLKAVPTVWNYGETGFLTFDDQYAMGMSNETFKFTKEEVVVSDLNNKLIILTDNPEGWKVVDVTYPTGKSEGWLSVSKTDGAANVKETISLLLTENNDPDSERIGYINLSAGRLTKTVTVTQTNSSAMNLDIYDADGFLTSELTFSSHSGKLSIDPQQFRVVWNPHTGSSQCQYIIFNSGKLPLFDFGLGTELLPADFLPNGTGDILFSNIKPDPFFEFQIAEDGLGNPFFETASNVEFTVKDGSRSMTKNLMLRLTNYAAVPALDNIYVMDGGYHTFNIKSNSSWKVTLVDNDKGVVTDFTETTGGYNTSLGQPVRFKLVDDISKNRIYGTAAVKFRLECTNVDKYFPPREFTMDCTSGIIRESSNCYIVAPGSEAILIPVARANGSAILGDQLIKESDIIKAHLVWTDNPKGVNPESNIKLVSTNGTGSAGHVVVAPGTSTGNAVVAVTVNGVIRWSWHIWVTDYQPVGTGSPKAVWLDRNLGAMNATVGDPASYGLFYQWGRKDPFPGMRVATAGITTMEAAAQKLYGADGVELTYGQSPNSKLATGICFLTTIYADNLINSIENPKYFYTTYTTPPTDWFTNNRNLIVHDLWDDNGNKTIYDPCPDGWRVPVRDPNLDYLNSPYHWGNNTASLYAQPGTPGLDKPEWLGGTNYGINWDYKGGYYPATGMYNITIATIRVQNIGTYGYYASASAPGGTNTTVYRFNFYGTTALPSQANSRQNTHSVRCVKE